MRKTVKLLLLCLICFFCVLSFANTATITVGNKEIVLPKYDGFTLITAQNPSEFKKIASDFSSDPNYTTYAYYVENNPGKLTRIISILVYTNVQSYLTPNIWEKAKNDIYEDSQETNTHLEKDAKAVQTVIESITTNSLYNTYINEIKLYLKNGDKYEYMFSNLEARTYIYLNGKIISISIVIDGENAYNVATIDWIKKTSQASAEKIIELNPPSEADLKLLKTAEDEENFRQIKYIIVIIAIILILIWKYGYQYFPPSIQRYIKAPPAKKSAKS